MEKLIVGLLSAAGIALGSASAADNCMDEPFLTHLLKFSLKVFRPIQATFHKSPSTTRRTLEERRLVVTMRYGSTVDLSGVDLTLGLFILIVHFVAQRIGGAREILEAGPLAKAERSSEERKRRVLCLSRPVESLTFQTSPYNGLSDFTR